MLPILLALAIALPTYTAPGGSSSSPSTTEGNKDSPGKLGKKRHRYTGGEEGKPNLAPPPEGETRPECRGIIYDPSCDKPTTPPPDDGIPAECKGINPPASCGAKPDGEAPPPEGETRPECRGIIYDPSCDKPTTPPPDDGIPAEKPTTPPADDGLPADKPTAPPPDDGIPAECKGINPPASCGAKPDGEAPPPKGETRPECRGIIYDPNCDKPTTPADYGMPADTASPTNAASLPTESSTDSPAEAPVYSSAKGVTLSAFAMVMGYMFL